MKHLVTNRTARIGGSFVFYVFIFNFDMLISFLNMVGSSSKILNLEIAKFLVFLRDILHTILFACFKMTIPIVGESISFLTNSSI